MKNKQIPDTSEKIYELKKDATTPAGYWRAGVRKTKAEWEKEFNKPNMTMWEDWFIDTSNVDAYNFDKLGVLIRDVFDELGLYSMSYKYASRKVAELWLKQNQQK